MWELLNKLQFKNGQDDNSRNFNRAHSIFSINKAIGTSEMKEENEDQTKGVTSQDQNGKVTPRSTENNSNEIMGSSWKDDDFGEAP